MTDFRGDYIFMLGLISDAEPYNTLEIKRKISKGSKILKVIE